MAHDIPRPEHPRPDFQRSLWQNLNGQWQFAFDDQDVGHAQGWQNPGHALDREITVPFCFQSPMSGIHDLGIHPILWYRRSFSVPAEMAGQRVLLTFGAVDFACEVFINGAMAGTHQGGYTPFDLDITDSLIAGENDLCVRVEDYPDVTQPRGKQYWQEGVMGCWYTPTSGIWQTVYLQAVGQNHVQRLRITPDIDRRMARVELTFSREPQAGCTVRAELSFGGKAVRTMTLDVSERVSTLTLDVTEPHKVDELHHWSPERPNLYDLRLTLAGPDGEALDAFDTYFGMRKISLHNGWILLNNRPLYQRLVLDQGYWVGSLITPPSDEAIIADIRHTKAYGFNGARKHQKLEDPRYYYWADKLGLLVWGEVPSPYHYAAQTVQNVTRTMMDFIDRDYNHPSLIAWVPLNESWGVRNIGHDPQQQDFGRALYHLCKAMDPTRLVSTNDGWEQVTTDICAIHDYTDRGEVLTAHMGDREQLEAHAADWRLAWADGEMPTGEEAFMVTEYGGIAFDDGGKSDTWGYHGKVTSQDAFFARYASVTDAIRALPFCQGYCYTQLTDVMQEINGLLDADHQPKVDVERFRAANKNPLARP